VTIGAYATAVLLAGAAMGQEDTTRSITAEKFLKARPASDHPAAARPVYQPVGSAKTSARPPAGAEVVDLGVTVWRLRQARSADPARLLVQDADGMSQWTPERVRAGAPLAAGDRVRISIESPRAGYLYVVDRELNADKTTGEPYLIFPTTRTRGGDNKVAGGRVIEIPAQDDRPPFFTVRPSRPDQVGERLTIVVSDSPLADVTIGAEAVKVSQARVDEWEAQGAASIQQLELAGGAGRPWSAAEQKAGADTTRLLRQDDPPPQTLFRVVIARPGFLAVNVVLNQAKR
jgi:hypothetical protein